MMQISGVVGYMIENLLPNFQRFQIYIIIRLFIQSGLSNLYVESAH